MARRSRFRFWLTLLDERISPAVFTVLNTSASGAGSLAQAITNANNTAGADSIVFDATVFAIAQAIVLGGQQTVSEAVTIIGPAAKVTIDANKSGRIFNIDVPSLAGQLVSLSDMTLTNGKVSGTNNGGAILDNDEALSLTRVSILNCTTTGSGGAVAVSLAAGSLTLNDCILSSNSATSTASKGGAVFMAGASVISVTRCTIANNTAGQYGGGISSDAAGGQLTLNDSTLSGNRATQRGGALSCYSQSALIRNCTLSGNSATTGGAIRAGAVFSTVPLNIQNSTIVYNSATSSGGIDRVDGTISLVSSIIAKNTATTGAQDITGPINADFTLIGDTVFATITGSNNKLNTDPVLNPLGNYGGPTQTQPPAGGSPVIDAGNNPAGLTSDQRGFARIQGAACDIGAVEGPGPIPAASASLPDITTTGATSQTVVVTYYDDVAIDVATLGTGDITVTGPNGFSATPTFASVDVPTNGVPRVATYQFTPPGGSWDRLDFGTYAVQLKASEVTDTDSPTANAVPASTLCLFHISIASTLVVDLTTDESDGNYSAGDLSLREALLVANGNVHSADTITFDPTVFSTSKTTVMSLGAMAITDPVSVIGPAAQLTINANNASRVFNISVPNQITGLVSIAGMTLTNGNGGAIASLTKAMALSDLTINNCAANSGGGALFLNLPPDAIATINGCTFSGNSETSFSFGGGGAIYALGSGSLIIARSTFSGNSATGAGGAIYFLGGHLTLTDSTLSGNKAGTPPVGTGPKTGGGLCLINVGTTIRNCTISGNRAAERGGGIAGNGPDTQLIIQNSTIAFNTVSTSGGGGGIYGQSGATFSLESTIVAKNTAPAGGDVAFNVLTSVPGNNNLIGAADTVTVNLTGTNNILGTTASPVDPHLGPLATNGGSTQTHALLAGSPAINAGSNPASLAVDQRGGVFVRVFGTAADIGAFEVQPTTHLQTVQVNDGSIQRSMVTSLLLTFDQTVTLPPVPASAFVLKRQSDNAIVNLNALASGNAVTLTFTGGAVDGSSLSDGRYTLTVFASQINGGNFDGNGDGTPGDNYLLVGDPAQAPKLFRLFGDADGNGLVDGLDFGAFRSAFNSNSVMFDFDGTGVVDATDFGEFRMRFGVVI